MLTRSRLLVILLGTMVLQGTACAEEVVGYGERKVDAEQIALDNARDEVIRQLRDRKANLKWTPTTEYLRQRGMVIDTLHDPEHKSDEFNKTLHKVTVTLRVRESDLREMLKQDRLLQRHLLAAKLLAALVVLLAALAAYLRLEDLTRGYYTGRLRTALGACVAAVGAGLWVLW